VASTRPVHGQSVAVPRAIRTRSKRQTVRAAPAALRASRDGLQLVFQHQQKVRTFRKFLDTHDKLRQEIRPLPTLDPGTDRSDDTDVWLAVAHAQSAIMGILGMSDDELFRHTDDLRRIAQALNVRITSIED